MKSVQTFGIIPVKGSVKPLSVLLLKHVRGSCWGFPKGHGMKSEGPEHVAKRELKEETNLSIKAFLPLSPVTISFTFSKHLTSIKKFVTLFYATIKGKLEIQKSEIIEGQWVSADKLLCYAYFETDHLLFKRVKSDLSKL